MVILRDLDNEDERNPPRPLIIGSTLECQVREHFTRPDGSFNYSGYFAEALGESFSPRELEGSSSDDSNDSSSRNSSNCVIISPSSFTGKRRDESLAIVDVGPGVMAMEVSSTYQSIESVVEFREKFDVSGTFDEKDVILEPVEEGQYVLGVPRSEHVSFYMHTRLIEDLHLYFLFTESRLIGSLMSLLLNLALIVGHSLKLLN
ncbi:hypothetical protein QL285_008355 [Trifolium repens]|nr:hypothetical protein QL285_008355 [Trifolium repens]